MFSQFAFCPQGPPMCPPGGPYLYMNISFQNLIFIYIYIQIGAVGAPWGEEPQGPISERREGAVAASGSSKVGKLIPLQEKVFQTSSSVVRIG